MKNQEHVERILLHHLRDKAGKTVLLSGPWGCGKTFLWRTKIAPQLDAEKPITLSLFGVESLSAFKIALMNASLVRRASLIGEKKFDDATKNLKALFGAGLRKGIDLLIGSEFLSSQIDPIQLIEDGLVICFDDLERTSPSLPLKEVLGLATLLAEAKGARVLLVTNETALAGSDEETATVLRQYKERVVHHQLTLEADVETTYSLFASRWESDESIHALLIKEREHITSVFSQSGCSNLRTLSRSLAGVAELARVLGPARIRREHVLLATALRVESDAGKLKEREFYDFNGVFALGLKLGKESPLNSERLDFLHRYYRDSDVLDYSYSGSIYDFIVLGYLLEDETRAELAPAPQEMSQVDQVLSETKGGEWFFFGDTELSRFASRLEDAIASKDALVNFKLFSLWIYLNLALRRLDKLPSEETAQFVRRRVLENVARLDDTFDGFARTHFSEVQDTWYALADEYDRELARQKNIRELKELGDIIDKHDKDAFAHAVVRNPAVLLSVLREPLVSKLTSSWRQSRRFHYYALSLLAEELEKYDENVVPEIGRRREEFARVIQGMLADTSLGISDRKRFEALCARATGWLRE